MQAIYVHIACKNKEKKNKIKKIIYL